MRTGIETSSNDLKWTSVFLVDESGEEFEIFDDEDGYYDLIDLWIKRAKRHAEEDK